MRQTTTAEVRLDDGKSGEFQRREVGNPTIWLPTGGGCSDISLRRASMRWKITPGGSRIRGMSVNTECGHGYVLVAEVSRGVPPGTVRAAAVAVQ